MSKAVSYASNQWQALRRYTEDGRLSIDNNVSERTLRHQAIGRKNWLFLGSRQAGPRAAVLFTILAGAKRHRIEPWTYLRELLLRLHDDDSRLDEMLPDQMGRQSPRSRAHLSARRIPPQSGRKEHAPPSRTNQRASPADQRPDTMPRPDAYSLRRVLGTLIADMSLDTSPSEDWWLRELRRRLPATQRFSEAKSKPVTPLDFVITTLQYLRRIAALLVVRMKV